MFKVKINYLTYFFILAACLSGMFKNFIILAFIIIIHELGHYLIIKYFKYEVVEIEFYPFGGQTKIQKDINTPLKEEFFIAISGVMAQLIFSFFVFALFYAGNISIHDYLIFKTYTLTILIFNLLPIIPLDGSIIIKTIFEGFFSYKVAFIISTVISIFFIILFITYNYLHSLNNYLIISFLLYKTINEISKFKYCYNKFLLERYLKRFSYKKIKILKYSEISKMQKERNHFFYRGSQLLNEKLRLKKLFDNNN